VAIQGLGSVGARVAEFLFWEGARLILSDIDRAKTERLASQFHGEAVSPDDILFVECDILCPCAMGGIINEKTIDKLHTEAVAGATNNQLLDMVQDAQHLLDRGILYAPDYVINAGGVINVAHEMHPDTYDAKRAMQDAINRLLHSRKLPD
jgi:leucine dehydrogenase